MTSQADWQVGSSSSGIDLTTSPGSVKLLSEYKIDTTGMSITATIDEGNKGNVVDGNTSTSWGGNNVPTYSWIIDLGSGYSITKAIGKNVQNTLPIGLKVWTSPNGSDYTEKGLFITGDTELSINTSDVRYIKLTPEAVSPPAASTPITIGEMEIYFGPSTATHTSGATQIFGTNNFWQWQTFTPTYTKPANTDIQFRFRSSADGSSWNGWTDYQSVASGGSANLIPLIASWSGTQENPGTFYKYIQVESKLTSTDGVSTPTLSEYSIGYHTNRPPDKPVAGTVIIGN